MKLEENWYKIKISKLLFYNLEQLRINLCSHLGVRYNLVCLHILLPKKVL